MSKIKDKVNKWIDKHLDKFLNKILDDLEEVFPPITDPLPTDNQQQTQPVTQPEPTPTPAPEHTPEPTPVQPTPTPTPTPTPVSDDEVSYNDLNFCWGGFSKKNASIVSLISNLSVNTNGMSYKWKSGGCEKMGASSKTDAGATLACLFCKINNKWQGGKFDWISTSRTTRDFANIKDGYNGWSKTAIKDASEYAFCIVSYKNNTRTNVIKCSKRFAAQSTTSDIISIVKSLISFLVGKSEKKAEKKDKIMAQIETNKEALKHALADGRITDAGAIQKNIDKLYKKFNKVGLFSVFVLSLMLAGCTHEHAGVEYTMPPVLGERVMIVNPGKTMEIPQLVPPARKWYLVDDVGLTQWLGIPQSAQP